MTTIIEQTKDQGAIVLNVNIPITREQIEMIIVGALEGGSNFWYWLEKLPKNTPDGEFTSLQVTEGLISVPNYALPVQDIDTRETVGQLTLKSLTKAIEQTAKNYPHYFRDLMAKNLDANGSDLIFQLAVMGEERYC